MPEERDSERLLVVIRAHRALWDMPLIPERQRQAEVGGCYTSSRPAWSTEGVPSQSGLHNEIPTNTQKMGCQHIQKSSLPKKCLLRYWFPSEEKSVIIRQKTLISSSVVLLLFKTKKIIWSVISSWKNTQREDHFTCYVVFVPIPGVT